MLLLALENFGQCQKFLSWGGPMEGTFSSRGPLSSFLLLCDSPVINAVGGIVSRHSRTQAEIRTQQNRQKHPCLHLNITVIHRNHCELGWTTPLKQKRQLSPPVFFLFKGNNLFNLFETTLIYISTCCPVQHSAKLHTFLLFNLTKDSHKMQINHSQ